MNFSRASALVRFLNADEIARDCRPLEPSGFVAIQWERTCTRVLVIGAMFAEPNLNLHDAFGLESTDSTADRSSLLA